MRRCPGNLRRFMCFPGKAAGTAGQNITAAAAAVPVAMVSAAVLLPSVSAMHGTVCQLQID